MQTVNTEVFDEIITGTATTWYTPAEFNSNLGLGDLLAIMAYVTNVSGTSPTLTVQIEHSGNNQNWFNAQASPEISQSITSNSVYFGSELGVTPLLLTYVRLRIALGGTNPQCRLKLTVTGRAL